MSGIVGSKLNIRGSGRIAKLGTDGQVLTSAGAGLQANYEDAAAGGTSWQSVETGATFTAVAGNGYPVNTTAQACTVTLPASASVGDTIEFTDYAGTWDTNILTLARNGLKIKGGTSDLKLNQERQGIKIVYMDATQGWVAATGVNEDAPALKNIYEIDFLVVAGGGGGASGGGGQGGGGGGAGGYRTATESEVAPGVVITVTVGDGGAGGDNGAAGSGGSASSYSGTGITTIASSGGGRGGFYATNGNSGGSGGGGGFKSPASAGGSGNSGGYTPVEGYAGGAGGPSTTTYAGGGGGGHAAVGGDASATYGGAGGTGTDNSISGSSVGYAGGGGGGANGGTDGGPATHGGGAGGKGVVGTDGTVNTGGGGGGAGGATSNEGGDGGKGVIVLSMPDGSYSGTTTGSPTVATGQGGSSDLTTLVFTATGSYTT